MKNPDTRQSYRYPETQMETIDFPFQGFRRDYSDYSTRQKSLTANRNMKQRERLEQSSVIGSVLAQPHEWFTCAKFSLRLPSPLHGFGLTGSNGL